MIARGAWLVLLATAALLALAGCAKILGYEDLPYTPPAPVQAQCNPGDAGNCSCREDGGGRTNCGDAESCCTSLPIDGGTYRRAYPDQDAGTGLDAGPEAGASAPATVLPFALDKYLVTVGRFEKFVDAWAGGGPAGYKPAAAAGKHALFLQNSGAAGDLEPGWDPDDDLNVAPTDENLTCDPNFATWAANPYVRDALPINCVTWAEAYAFCIWDGGFLPSEAEWEYAAAGGADMLAYPWGMAAPDEDHAIFACNTPTDDEGCPRDGEIPIAPVGQAFAGAGLFGQLDLAGNLYEWTLDWYAGYTYCNSCANTSPALVDRVMRGGAYSSPWYEILPQRRAWASPTSRSATVGFRCGRAP